VEEVLCVTSDAPGFAPVPLRLLGDERIKDPSTIAVYVALASFADYGSGDCFPSLATIGKRAHVNEQTARRHITRLAELGYLVKTSGKDRGRANTYHLVDPWGRKQGQPPVVGGSVTGDLGGSSPVTDKRDSMNKNQERESAPPSRSPSQDHTSDAALSFVSDLLEKMRQEAQARGAPPSFIQKAWSKEILELQRCGVGEGELLEAFRACLERAPDRLTFFPRDFLKWRRVSRDRRAREHQHQKQDREREALERERKIERERILSEHGDPQVAARIEAEIASLPWKRRKEGAK
jgi:hypothetical protein